MVSVELANIQALLASKDVALIAANAHIVCLTSEMSRVTVEKDSSMRDLSNALACEAQLAYEERALLDRISVMSTQMQSLQTIISERDLTISVANADVVRLSQSLTHVSAEKELYKQDLATVF